MRIDSAVIQWALASLIALYVLGPLCGIMLYEHDHKMPSGLYACFGNMISIVFTSVLTCISFLVVACCNACLENTIQTIPSIEQGLSINNDVEISVSIPSQNTTLHITLTEPTGQFKGYSYAPGTILLLFGPLTTLIISDVRDNLTPYEYVLYGNLFGWGLMLGSFIALCIVCAVLYGVATTLVIICAGIYHCWLKCFEYIVLNIACARRTLLYITKK